MADSSIHPPSVSVDGVALSKAQKKKMRKLQSHQDIQTPEAEAVPIVPSKSTDESVSEGEKDQKREALKVRLQERRRSRSGEDAEALSEGQRKADAASAIKAKLDARRKGKGEEIELGERDDLTALIGKQLLYPSPEQQEAVSSPKAASASSPRSAAPVEIDGWKKSAILIGKWEPDESRIGCTSCSVEFTFFTRRHHCRRCCRIFCADCSRGQMMLPCYPGLVRVCDACQKPNHK